MNIVIFEHRKIFKFLTTTTLGLIVLTSASAFADFGSKYRDEHRKDRGESQDERLNESQIKKGSRNTDHTQNIPFDFDDIAYIVGAMHKSAIDEVLGGHIDQAHLESLSPADAFIEAFEAGDELFEIKYNSLDGIGINVGNGKRFSSVPRLDLKGSSAWASVLPHRITGPNGDSCLGCHNDPVSDGAGGVNDNTIRVDPERRQPGFIERQTPHIFGMGGVQLVAEEMTTQLQSQRDTASNQACSTGVARPVDLVAKGIRFGRIHVACDLIQYQGLKGIDENLVVKPFEWKGLTAFVRDFVRGASHQELGMQAVELVGNTDSDFDGITNEFTVGDITALAVYAAGQQRPVTKLELNQVVAYLSDEELTTYGLPLTSSEITSINRGEIVFENLQCASCHTPMLTAANPIFSEPSRHENYRDDVFPAGESVALPRVAIQFDITRDIFVNEISLPNGQTLGEFERSNAGAAIVRLYGDLKRHDMGREMAEDIDEGNLGASVFMTENLWGVGNTAPYLHDGRATTLTEAILLHGGEARKSQDRFRSANTADQTDLLAFLDNLVLFIR